MSRRRHGSQVVPDTVYGEFPPYCRCKSCRIHEQFVAQGNLIGYPPVIKLMTGKRAEIYIIYIFFMHVSFVLNVKKVSLGVVT